MKFEQKQELREFNCLYKEIEKLYHDIAIKAGMSDSSFFILIYDDPWISCCSASGN